MTAYLANVVEPSRTAAKVNLLTFVPFGSMVVERIVQDAEERIAGIGTADKALVVDHVRERFPAEGEEPVRDIDGGVRRRSLPTMNASCHFLAMSWAWPNVRPVTVPGASTPRYAPVRNEPV